MPKSTAETRRDAAIKELDLAAKAVSMAENDVAAEHAVHAFELLSGEVNPGEERA